MKIILDYDATLVDLMGPWLNQLKWTHKVNLTTKDVKYFGWLRDALGHNADDFWRTPGVYDIVHPLPLAQEFVNKLFQMGYEVEVCSSSHEAMFEEKEAHCKKLFGLKMTHSHAKHELTEGCILVDDCPRHIHAHTRENRTNLGLIFNHKGQYGWAKPLVPHRYVRVVKTYRQIINLIGDKDGSFLFRRR